MRDEVLQVLAEEPARPKPSERGNLLRVAIAQIVTQLTPPPTSKRWTQRPEDTVWIRNLIDIELNRVALDLDEDAAAAPSAEPTVHAAVLAERAACVAYLRNHPENSITVLSGFIHHGKHVEEAERLATRRS